MLGLLTYGRAMQQSIEDMHLMCGVNRIRNCYSHIAPEPAPYFMNSIHDDYAGFTSDMGPKRFQGWLTKATAIALVEAVLGGAIAGIAPTIFMHAAVPVTIAAALGAIAISQLVIGALHRPSGDMPFHTYHSCHRRHRRANASRSVSLRSSGKS